jgi:transposase-like protein
MGQRKMDSGAERAMNEQEPMSRLCREFGISRPAGYFWKRRYQQTGSLSQLVQRSRRPLQPSQDAGMARAACGVAAGADRLGSQEAASAVA